MPAMTNRIPCSAERLNLLVPQMIQSIAQAAAFRVARQYVMEKRVRISDANDSRILSTLIGNAGLYEQQIHLKDGHLVSACSCSVPEEPLCRHSIAVLLEYHRWAGHQESSPSSTQPESPSRPQTHHSNKPSPPALQSSVADITLSEILKLVEWLQPAMKAIEKEQPLPPSPTDEAGGVSAWILAIKSLDDRRRETEDVLVTLEAELRDRNAYAARLTQQLQASMAELKTAQAVSRNFEREVNTYRATLAKLGELTSEVAQYDEQIRTAAREILEKGSHFDKVAMSCREVAETLHASVKTTPQP
ncbi:MAG: hypothetical protein A4C66_03970 [Nitrospira sp. HN-bin3]|jgi:hypothetical protein|nr:MAG: hypothetical protein A4C66_03970 [Nitrospira sp. HN-bin3]